MGRAKPKSRSTSKRGQGVSRLSSKASSSRGRSHSKGKKTARKAKDKRRPKRALGPYMYFCKDQRRDVQEQNPNMSFGDIGRVLGSQWSRLNDRDKQKYVRKAQSDKRRYEKEMKRYKPRH